MANFKENKRHHFTYKTINLLNNRYYLGMHSTNNLKDSYLGSGKRLWCEIRKYGKENFTIEILEYFDTREKLVNAEINLIKESDLKNKNCLNLKLGGNGGIINEEHALALHKGSSKYQKVKWENIEYRNKITSVLKNNIKENHRLGKIKYDTFKNKHHSEETKEKMRQHKGKQEGNKNSQFGTCWIHNEELKQNKKINKTEQIPNGWKLGRKIK